MKKNDKRIDRVYSFFNAIRGNNTPNEYQSVLAVLKKSNGPSGLCSKRNGL